MLLLLSALLLSVRANNLHESIYTSIDFGNGYCFRLNNHNSQIGCQTSRDGDYGILYQFESVDELENNFQDLDKPVIPIINASIFNNFTASLLLKHSKTRGLILLEDNKKEDFVKSGESYSPEKSCPGNGFNYGETASQVDDQKCLSDNPWNPKGNWLSYYDFPFGIFIITSEYQKEAVLEKAKANKENTSLKPYPLWGGEVKAFMNTAQNTETCMRRGTCQPIGGLNVNINLTPRTKEDKRPIILFITKADATAFFKHFGFGGKDSGVSIAALFGVMKVLSIVRDKDNFDSSSLNSQIMISFLQGESFDYSGSQRLAYDLKNEKFGKEAYNISLVDVKCIIEIGPLPSVSTNLWQLYLHSPKEDATVKQIQDLFARDSNQGFQFKNIISAKFPPSSMGSFLRENDNIPCVLLTDAQTEMASEFFGSRYDAEKNSESLTTKVTNLVKIIGNVALKLAGDETTQVELEDNFVGDVLDCMLDSQNCTLYRRYLNGTSKLHDAHLDRFSSVGQKSNYTILLNHLAHDFSKKKLELSIDDCNATMTAPWDPYRVNNTCYGTVVNRTHAVSPAFKLKQYSSTQYSTWTESVWSPKFTLRLFLLASNSENISLFCGGLIYFLVSSALIFQCHRKSDEIFSEL